MLLCILNYNTMRSCLHIIHSMSHTHTHTLSLTLRRVRAGTSESACVTAFSDALSVSKCVMHDNALRSANNIESERG